MVLFQNGVRQLHSPAKMAATVQFRCYWKQLWSRWAITGSWEPLVFTETLLKFIGIQNKGLEAIRAKIGPTSDVDKIFSKMYSQHVLFRNKYS